MDLVDGDEEKAKGIAKVKEDVNKYLFFKRAIDLGITFTKNDLSFTEILLFSLIKDSMNG